MRYMLYIKVVMDVLLVTEGRSKSCCGSNAEAANSCCGSKVIAANSSCGSNLDAALMVK